MKKYINNGCVVRVKREVDLVEHIQSQLPLKRVGDHFRGTSPFCDDPRNDALVVYPREQKFACEKTKIRGDIIDFERKSNGLEFVEAVELLALKYGLYVEYVPNGRANKRNSTCQRWKTKNK